MGSNIRCAVFVAVFFLYIPVVAILELSTWAEKKTHNLMMYLVNR